MAVIVGSVEPFPGIEPDKAQALKPLEEAAEVYGAWQAWRDSTAELPESVLVSKWSRDDLLKEIADTIQACCNLAQALGCDDLRPYLADVEMKNRNRGRYED